MNGWYECADILIKNNGSKDDNNHNNLIRYFAKCISIKVECDHTFVLYLKINLARLNTKS